MNDFEAKKFCLALLHADSEAEAVKILRMAGFWDDEKFWRLYGDKEGNFAQAGNQQALPEAALVEKIVNCCDSRLMSECIQRGIDPESAEAPVSVRDAVAMFFEGRRAVDSEAGSLVNWGKTQRLEQSRFITIAATGDRPARGHTSKRMCLTIADQAEGQSPARLPFTILSLNAKNKQRIRFVQGKFNMGGSGALRFCGALGLQLVISRRNPALLDKVKSADPSDSDWAVTVVRREQPTDKAGEPVSSEFTYLAPIGAESAPRKGSVLHFKSKSLPLMPDDDRPYVREIEWGTAIKLYEYETSVGQSNVLLSDGLLYALERLLPQIALPIRIHECRGYQGHKGSFETPIAGLVVRLEDGRGDNLEKGFPLSVQLQIADMQMTARIYAFKEERATTYLKDEGVIFAINGQAHGNFPKSIFSRPKQVGLPRLKDSLLVLVDCSSLKAIQREDLFMSSRDRLSKKPIRYAVEDEIEALLRNNTELRRLQQERRQQDVESKLSEERPLEEVLGRIFKSSPALKTLFLQGQRLARPFAGDKSGDGGDFPGPDKGTKAFIGKRHPTYFRVPGIPSGTIYRRNCELGRRVQIKFETDVENEYFDRATDRGLFELRIIDSARELSSPTYSLGLEDGFAHLNMALPPELEVGDKFALQASVNDPTLLEPLISLVTLTLTEKQDRPRSDPRPKPPIHGGGNRGIALPHIIPVHEGDDSWRRHAFSQATACHVVSDPIEENGQQVLDHTFYVNVDNVCLKTEMKYSKQDSRLLEAKFKYANVLLGLAILHDAENRHATNGNGGGKSVDDRERKDSPQETIRKITEAIAPMVIPVIDQLSGLTEEQLEEVSSTGEDG